MGFVENDVIMIFLFLFLFFMFLSKLLHVHALYNVLCCGVHTIFLIKCLFLCVFWTLSSTKFENNHASMFGTTNGYVFHTLPLA